MHLASTVRAALLVTLLLTLPTRAADFTKDSLAKIKTAIEEDKAVLVDVREKKEWDSGHIEGAIFLPLSGLRDGVTKEELEPLPKDKILYVHCVVGKRALSAAKILERHEYKVRPMEPGYKEMVAAGFPKAND